MIHSARPTVSPETNNVFTLISFVLLDFEKWGPTFSDCGLAEWIN